MSTAALLMSASDLPVVYDENVLARLRSSLGRLTVIAPAIHWRQHTLELADVDVVFSGWGAPRMDEAFLQHMPALRAIFYAGGSVGYFVTDSVWQRGIRLTSAQAVNAIPVAEYATSALLLGLKRVWSHAAAVRAQRTFPRERPLPGAFRSKVGLVSFGMIARLVRDRLLASDVDVLVYDPFLSPSEAAAARVRPVGLDELFATADAVSLHAPHRAETTALIRGRHFALMKEGAFFLNTARGEIVAESEMIAVLQRRPDLFAMLDVTAPEPPLTDSLLYSLPNVVVTPHLAGSVGPECARMGHAMVDEFERYCAGQPLKWEIDAQRAALLA
jgi:phosphoglycerate dehydrogenase-like enzyme